MNEHTHDVDRPAESGRRGGVFLGWSLILLGVVLLLGMHFHISGGWFLLVLGGAFLAWYFESRNYGLLVPAGILLGLGLGVVLSEVRPWFFDFEWELFWIGTGFVAIYIIDRVTWHQSTTWPLWPGGVLILISLWQSRWFEDLFDWLWWEILGDWWPVLLILWGVWLLRRGRRGRHGTPGPVGGAQPPTEAPPPGPVSD
jgi:hypothetical protein